MNDQLDHAVRSVLADIISTAPHRDEHPIRTVGVIEMPTRPRRPYLVVAAAALAVVGVGGVALVNSRDAGPAPASASSASVPDAAAGSTSDTTVTAAPTSAPEDPMADLFQHVGYRVKAGDAQLAALGFPDHRYSIDGDGVTTLTASDAARPDERNLTIVMTPGVMLQPEDHRRTPVSVVEHTTTLIRVENRSNNGWVFSVQVVDLGDGTLPTLEELQELIYALDP